MKGFRKISPDEISENVIKLISRDWMLVTAGDESSYNTMTASWGSVGFMWGKPVAQCYVRPQRYTYEFMEKSDTYTLTFFPDGYKDALNLCGTKKSGRDLSIKPETPDGYYSAKSVDGCVSFKEAKLVLVLKKLYHQDMKKEAFDEASIVSKDYPNGDFHRIYIGEILSCYVK